MVKHILPAVLYCYYLSSLVCLLAGPALVAAGCFHESWPTVAGGSAMILYGWSLGSRISEMLSTNTQADSITKKMEHLLYTASALRDKGKGAN